MTVPHTNTWHQLSQATLCGFTTSFGEADYACPLHAFLRVQQYIHAKLSITDTDSASTTWISKAREISSNTPLVRAAASSALPTHDGRLASDGMHPYARHSSKTCKKNARAGGATTRNLVQTNVANNFELGHVEAATILLTGMEPLWACKRFWR